MNSSKTAIGIDPGLHGAVAAITETRAEIWDTPTIVSGGRRQYVVSEMVAILRQIVANHGPVFAALEQVHAMPRQGVVSTATLARGAGLWEGMLQALGIPYLLVPPQTWKRAMLVGMSPRDKAASRLRAIQLFPQLHDRLARRSDHNRAEALLIAAWAKRFRWAG